LCRLLLMDLTYVCLLMGRQEVEKHLQCKVLSGCKQSLVMNMTCLESCLEQVNFCSRKSKDYLNKVTNLKSKLLVLKSIVKRSKIF